MPWSLAILQRRSFKNKPNLQLVFMKKIRIKLFSFDCQLLQKAADRIVKAVESSQALIRGPFPLPTKREIFTVLRSPHVNKKSRNQYVQYTHKRLIDICPMGNANTIDILMKLELPPGIEVSIKA